MSILHLVYTANQKCIKWLKDQQRKRKDKADIQALMMEDNKNSLTYEQKKEIAKYWKPYGKTDPIFFQHYFEKNDIYDVKYLPDDLYYTEIQYYYNDISAARIVDHKAYYEMLFPDFIHPETIARRLNGYWIIKNKCLTVDEVWDVLCGEKMLFIKPATDSCGGAGIVILENESLCKENFNESIKVLKGDIVIQRRVVQCDELSKLNESSVNTMRFMTLLEKNGDVAVLSRSLRMGFAGNRLDNASSGGISIGINEDGKLKDFALSLDGKRYYKHPNSGVIFKDYKLPNVELIDECVKKSALRVPAFRIIAWDIILDVNHIPLLIEANLYNAGMNVPQLSNGPLFGERTEEFLNEVYGLDGVSHTSKKS